MTAQRLAALVRECLDGDERHALLGLLSYLYNEEALRALGEYDEVYAHSIRIRIVKALAAADKRYNAVRDTSHAA